MEKKLLHNPKNLNNIEKLEKCSINQILQIGSSGMINIYKLGNKQNVYRVNTIAIKC